MRERPPVGVRLGAVKGVDHIRERETAGRRPPAMQKSTRGGVASVVQRVMSADNLSLGCEIAMAEKDQLPSMRANWKAIESSARARSNGQQVQCFGWMICSEASTAPMLRAPQMVNDDV